MAKADVTPPPGVRMYGYGARGENVSTGVHDPLYAKAIVLSDGQRTAAWVTMDLGYADKPLTRDVRAAVSAALGFDDVFLTSSHTHSGPTFVPDFPSAATPWVQELRRKVIAAIVEAHGALQPARLGVGWGQVDLGHNRRRVRADGTVEMLWENRRGIPTSPRLTSRLPWLPSIRRPAIRSPRSSTWRFTRWCSGRRTWSTRPTIPAR